MIRRTLAVAVKELLQLRRDWRTTLTLLGMPMVLLLIYGYALSFDVAAHPPRRRRPRRHAARRAR